MSDTSSNPLPGDIVTVSIPKTSTVSGEHDTNVSIRIPPKWRRGKGIKIKDTRIKKILKSKDSLAKERSAFTYLCKISFNLSNPTTNFKPPVYEAKLAEFFRGIHRQDAERRSNGELSAKIGSDPLLYMDYKEIQKATRDGDVLNPKTAVFVNVYSSLCWNLMSRSINVEKIRMSHLMVSEDAIKIKFCVTKRDLVGGKMEREAKQVYANPKDPGVCPYVSLGIWIITRGGFEGSETNLFAPDAHSRFNKDMQRVLCAVPISSSDITGHSWRKGASTYATSGTTAPPSALAVCNRGGWDIGNVLKRYFHFGSVGDAYLGRILCGLDPVAVDFSLLCPHFGRDSRSAVVEVAKMLFPPALLSSPESESVCLRLLASLVFHRKYLAELPALHPIHASPLFQRVGDKTRAELLSDHLATTPELSATGIPPHVEILRKTESDKDEIISRMIEELDKRGIAAPHVTPQHLTSVMEKMYEEIRNIGRKTPTMNQRSINDVLRQDNTGALPNPFLPRCTYQRTYMLWHIGLKDRSLKTLSSRNFQTKAEGVRFSRWRNVCTIIDGLVTSSEREFDLTKIADIREALNAVDSKLDELRGYQGNSRNRKRHRFSASTVYNEIRRERKRRREEEQ